MDRPSSESIKMAQATGAVKSRLKIALGVTKTASCVASCRLREDWSGDK
jgi:hypothetical protein